MPPQFDLTPDGAGKGTLTLRGRLDMHSTTALWQELRKTFKQTPVSNLEVNATGIDYCDGAGLALLHYITLGGMTPPGANIRLQGLRPEYQKLFDKFTREDYEKNRPHPPAPKPITEEVGQAVLNAGKGVHNELSFIGDVTAGFSANLRKNRAMRWKEVWRVFDVAGINALPIISLISLLVGLIIAFEAAAPFAMFGAQIFIANMLGIIMAREMAGLMTGIILAGRSGSAFAAELGTMKVNEELNALTTMGLSPIRFLVVQRILAGIIVTPLLTVYAIFVSIVGGIFVMMAMGFSLVTIYNQMAQSLHYTDILIGVGKGVIFGALIAGIGCMRGLQTKQGPSAVGESTTKAVVTTILMLIIADAIVAVILYFLKL